jgi:hypothetical protein
MIGVWYSRTRSHMRRRIEATTSERSIMFACICLATQIEEAVFEPGFLGVLLIAEDLQRQFVGRRPAPPCRG